MAWTAQGGTLWSWSGSYTDPNGWGTVIGNASIEDTKAVKSGLNYTVTFVFKAAYTCANSGPGALVKVEYTKDGTTWANFPQGENGDYGSNPPSKTWLKEGDLVVMAGQKILFRLTVTIGPSIGYQYSQEWKPPEAVVMLQFVVTRPAGTADRMAGVWCTEEGQDNAYYYTNDGMPVYVGSGGVSASATTAVVTWYVKQGDTGHYYGGIVDQAASLATYGGSSIPIRGVQMAGSELGRALNGAVMKAGTATASKTAADGVTADLPTASSTVTPVSASTPINPTTPGTVPAGSTGPATGKEVTDSANAQIAQAHSDAAALQKSVDNVGSKIDNLAAKTGTGSGTGSQTAAEKKAEGEGMIAGKDDSRIAGIGSEASGKVDGYKSNFTSGQPYSGGAKAESTMTVPTYDSSGWSTTLPVLGTISIDPMSDSNLAAGATFCRGLFSWLLVVGFIVFASGQTMEIVKTLSLVQGTTSGPAVSVLGNTSSIPSALVKAGILTAITIAAIPAIYAAATGALPGFEWATIMGGAGPFASASGFVGKLVALADKFLPLGLICCMLINAAVLKLAGQAIIGGVAAAMRFAAA